LTLKTLAHSAPLRLVWTLLLFLGVNVALDRLHIAVVTQPATSTDWIYRNAAVALFVLWLSVRVLEGRRLRDVGLGLRGAPRNILGGFLVGAAAVTIIVGVLAALGAYRIEGLLTPSGTTRAALFARAFIALAFVALSEEIKTRGILFRLLEQSLGTWIAIALSALGFGFVHWANPGATLWGSLAIALEGGVLLAALYAATRSLWLPIGVHWGWNLFEGPVWGALVSGNSVAVFTRAHLAGPAVLTGGQFGPEAGLPALCVGGALGLGAVLWMIRRGATIAPPWMAQRQGGLAAAPQLSPDSAALVGNGDSPGDSR
jgi:membrane protease YdiL (CAAX protease family)